MHGHNYLGISYFLPERRSREEKRKHLHLLRFGIASSGFRIDGNAPRTYSTGAFYHEKKKKGQYTTTRYHHWCFRSLENKTKVNSLVIFTTAIEIAIITTTTTMRARWYYDAPVP